MEQEIHEGIDESKEDNIGKDSAISIHQLENGYLVRPYIHPHRDMGEAITYNQEYVFQTFKELQSFLNKHFSHRSTSVKTDQTIK